jgi:hypothetical protein
MADSRLVECRTETLEMRSGNFGRLKARRDETIEGRDGMEWDGMEQRAGAARLWSQRPETLVMSFFQPRSVVTLVNFPHRVSSFMNITMTEIELP